jgi:Urocanase Rossmann-like domain
MNSAAVRGESSLSGRLLYAADLDEPGRALACAANIAGAATLASSADLGARKQAMRDGIVDFLVTSLDEALRILKNQIRKGETVAVCVGAAPEAVEREMQERGVLPDLIAPLAAPHFARGSKQIGPGATQGPIVIDCRETGAAAETMQWLTWRASTDPARWLPQLDALVLACLPPGAVATRRWLQLAPRYLGRLAQGAHIVRISEKLAEQFIAQVAPRTATGEIATTIEVDLGPWGQSRHRKL